MVEKQELRTTPSPTLMEVLNNQLSSPELMPLVPVAMRLDKCDLTLAEKRTVFNRLALDVLGGGLKNPAIKSLGIREQEVMVCAGIDSDPNLKNAYDKALGTRANGNHRVDDPNEDIHGETAKSSLPSLSIRNLPRQDFTPVIDKSTVSPVEEEINALAAANIPDLSQEDKEFSPPEQSVSQAKAQNVPKPTKNNSNNVLDFEAPLTPPTTPQEPEGKKEKATVINDQSPSQPTLADFIIKKLNQAHKKSVRLSTKELADQATATFNRPISISMIRNRVDAAVRSGKVPRRKGGPRRKTWASTKGRKEITKERVRKALKEHQRLHPDEPASFASLAEALELNSCYVKKLCSEMQETEQLPPAVRRMPPNTYTSEQIEGIKRSILEAVKVLTERKPNKPITIEGIASSIKKPRSRVAIYVKELFGKDSVTKGKGISFKDLPTLPK